jgi:hypothetical protein
MGDFQLTPPTFGNLGRPSPWYAPGNRLSLFPEIEAQMRALDERIALLGAQIRAMQSTYESGQMRSLYLRPDWASLVPTWDPQWMFRQPSLTPPSSQPLFTPGAGPSTPRPAEMSDLLDAIWAVPPVQRAANRVLDDVTRGLRNEWRDAATGERVLMISAPVLIFGGTLAGVMANKPTRLWLLEQIKDTDIPVPGVNGLRFRLGPSSVGAAASFSPIRGVTLSGRINVTNAYTNPRLGAYEGAVLFDVAEWIRAAR